MKRIGMFALLACSWLLWSGHFDPLMLSFGLASCLLVFWLLRRLDVETIEPRSFNTLLRLPFYVPWLLWQVVLSNIAVARLVWRPKMQCTQSVNAVTSTQETSLGLVIFANSVTLTPGTLSIDAQKGSLLVHALEASSFEGEAFDVMDRRVSDLERP